MCGYFTTIGRLFNRRTCPRARHSPPTKKEAAPKGGFQFMSSFKPFDLELHSGAKDEEIQVLIFGIRSVIV